MMEEDGGDNADEIEQMTIYKQKNKNIRVRQCGGNVKA